MYGTEIPRKQQELTEQTELTEVNEEFYKSLFEEPQFLLFHKIFQFICFVLFFGIIKVIVFSALVLFWLIAIHILPHFESFFKVTIEYKLFAHKFLKKLIRMILFSCGFVRISVTGKMHPQTRLIVSNHVSFVDFFLFFYALPITLVKKADHPSWETFLTGSVFDIFYLKQRKSISPSEQLANVASDPSFLPILLFPEDKPTNGRAILPFRTAAYYTSYGVQSATIKYFLGLTPPGFNTITSKDTISFGLLWRIFSTPFITCTIKIMDEQVFKTESVSEEEEDRNSQSTRKNQPAQLALQSQLRIANDLGVIAISNSYNKNRKK